MGVASVALWPAQAFGQIKSGNDLLRYCEAEGSMFASGICYGYIQGVMDAIDLASGLEGSQVHNLCIPAQSNNGQIRDIVVAYLKSNPDKRHWQSAALVHNALNSAFCKKQYPQ